MKSPFCVMSKHVLSPLPPFMFSSEIRKLFSLESIQSYVLSFPHIDKITDVIYF